MSTATAPSPASLTGTDNSFTLHDAHHKTQVTYMPHRGGPILAGTTPYGGSLEYEGAEGNHTYTDAQITTEATAIGSLITVILKIVPDVQTLTFSVLMPRVTDKTAGSPQSFETIAIKATHLTPFTTHPPAGGNPTYQEMKMYGVAKAVELPK